MLLTNLIDSLLVNDLATLLHDVAKCFECGGQTHATFSSFLRQTVNVHMPQAPGAQEVDYCTAGIGTLGYCTVENRFDSSSS